MTLSWEIVVALIISGILVGFINTLAGSGTIISISLLIFLGLPPTVANGTNRIAVFFQNLVAVTSFRKKKMLNVRHSFWYAIPATIGSIVGAFIAIDIDDKLMQKIIAIIMLLMLLLMIFKPDKWLKGDETKIKNKPSIFQLILYFFIGVYGGFIHIGVGIFILAITVMNAGYDLIRANAIKNFIVFLYNPFSLLVFMYFGLVNYEYGLIHSIGNMLGAFLATKFALEWGVNFVRWLLIVVIILASSKMLGIIDYFIHF